MNFEKQVQKVKVQLEEVMKFTESDIDLIEHVKKTNKHLKKIISLSEREIEVFENKLGKVQKKINKIKNPDNGELNEEFLHIIGEYDEQIQKKRKEKMLNVICQLDASYQEYQKIIDKLKTTISDDGNEIAE